MSDNRGKHDSTDHDKTEHGEYVLNANAGVFLGQGGHEHAKGLLMTNAQHSDHVLSRGEGIVVRFALVEDVHGLGGEWAIKACHALEGGRSPSRWGDDGLVDVDVDVHVEGASRHLDSTTPSADGHTACVDI